MASSAASSALSAKIARADCRATSAHWLGSSIRRGSAGTGNLMLQTLPNAQICNAPRCAAHNVLVMRALIQQRSRGEMAPVRAISILRNPSR